MVKGNLFVYGKTEHFMGYLIPHFPMSNIPIEA